MDKILDRLDVRISPFTKKEKLMGIKIEDLPTRLQAQVRAQLENYAKPVGSRTSVPESAPTTTPTPVDDRGKRRHREPNKTETEYRRHHLRGMDARYEALTFRMANGHRYTPDWVVFTDKGKIECHEVKGGYALWSEQRARLAFDQAKVEFPWIIWVWAKKVSRLRKKTTSGHGGQWEVSRDQKEASNAMSSL